MTKLQRLAGFDVIIFPGFGTRMKTPDEEVLQSVQECLKPWAHIKPVLPFPAGSQWAASTAMLYERLKQLTSALSRDERCLPILWGQKAARLVCGRRGTPSLPDNLLKLMRRT